LSRKKKYERGGVILDAIFDGYTSSVTRRAATFATFSSRRRLKVGLLCKMDDITPREKEAYFVLTANNTKAFPLRGRWRVLRAG
jgi:hypothetical protein